MSQAGVLSRLSRSATRIGLLVGATLPASAGVIVVDDDGGPGVDHTDLGAAIAAAVAGDTILVRNGIYGGGFGPLFVDGIGLDLVADGANVVVRSPISVTNVPAGSEVRISGFDFEAPPFFQFGANVSLRDCIGPVWIESCTITGPVDPGKTAGSPLSAVDCASVVILGCTLQAGGPNGFGLPPLPGLSAVRSDVYTFDTNVLGTVGKDGSEFIFPSAGAAGASIHDGLLYAQRSSFDGGSGRRRCAELLRLSRGGVRRAGSRAVLGCRAPAARVRRERRQRGCGADPLRRTPRRRRSGHRQRRRDRRVVPRNRVQPVVELARARGRDAGARSGRSPRRLPVPVDRDRTFAVPDRAGQVAAPDRPADALPSSHSARCRPTAS